jgi:hypothetical protein
MDEHCSKRVLGSLPCMCQIPEGMYHSLQDFVHMKDHSPVSEVAGTRLGLKRSALDKKEISVYGARLRWR